MFLAHLIPGSILILVSRLIVFRTGYSISEEGGARSPIVSFATEWIGCEFLHFANLE